jgi:uncharacterized protein YyaL (SSP411 family)
MTLTEQYEKMRKKRGSGYKPRTRHLEPDGWARYTNRLFLESSPYLLQHAHNPVDWHAWGDEAFETARKKDCPVLLSVGYSTCHWCHVMEEESFEDEEIAEFINQNYVAVKVDREERPDVDAVYMTAVQALTGRGGWPMTVWLMPDRKPFYGGTYFPARDNDRGSHVGFLTLLRKIKESYDGRRGVITQSSTQITEAVQRILNSNSGNSLPGKAVFQTAIDAYKDRFDALDGGLKGAPKFPSTLPIRLLFRYDRRNQDTDIRDMARLTLDKMADGGMYDHVGGGFHRYSTDAQWLVPHFEKMLYDNALLAQDYLEAFQVFGDERYKRIVEETLQYVQQDMTDPKGGFYSATDADSLTPSGQREEGYFFTWTPTELESILGKDLAAIVSSYYAVGTTPNFEGRHILHRQTPAADIAAQFNISEKELSQAIKRSKKLLKTAREQRPLPLRDGKILAAWNGLMIAAFARAGFVLNSTAYTESAVNAADFILKHMVVDGRLNRSYKEGRARHAAYLDDYAFFIASLLDLYETTHDSRWFAKALELESVLAEHYEDQSEGGFFMTANDHEALIAKEKPAADGALPAGNAVAVMNLLRINKFTADNTYFTRAEKALTSLSGALAATPTAFAGLLTALDFHLDQSREIIIVVPQDEVAAADPFLAILRKHHLPNQVLSVVSEGHDCQALEKIMPIVRNRPAMDGKATAYVCQNHTCKLPTADPHEFARLVGVKQ